MSESRRSDQRKSPDSLMALALLLGISVLLVTGYFVLRREPEPAKNVSRDKVEVKKLSREQTQTLLSLRDQANAHLENLQFAKADEVFQEIIRLLPDDRLGHRNLTICRELSVDNEPDPEKKRLAITSAQESLQRLLAIDPQNYVTHVLAARVAIRTDDIDGAAASLRRAEELSPDSAPVLYDIYALRPIGPGEPPTAEIVATLRRLHELEPDNLYILKDWLLLQVQQKSPDAAQTVREARESLAPFFGVIRQHLNVDIQKMVDDLSASVDAGDWKTAERRVMPLRNVIAPEALRDERYVKFNSLEYLLHDFDPAFYDRATVEVTQSRAAIPVKFVNASGDHPLRLSPAAKDVFAADMNLDGRLDGITLHDNHFVVVFPLLTKTEDAAPESVTVSFEGDFRRLLAVDLDDDKDALIKANKEQSGGGHFTDPDLILFGPSGIKLFENRKVGDAKTREFIDRPVDAALGSLRDVVAVTPGDLDLDGDLDFLTISPEGIRLWSNRGNWTFEEITSRTKLPPADFIPTSTVVVDWDRDTDLDIVVAGASGMGVLENIHHGRFRWRELGGEFKTLKNAVSLIAEELDENGSWDLIGSGPTGLNIVLTKTSAAGIVSAIRTINQSEAPVSKVTSLDFDNDGNRDLLVQGTNVVNIWRGHGTGHFEPFELKLAGSPDGIAPLIVVDVDSDGDEDLVQAKTTDCEWISNDGGNANGWMNISLVADQYRPNEQNYSKRVNHAGIGCSIEVRTGTHYQTQCVKGATTHFGLGTAPKADVVRILWTNGIPRNILECERNLEVVEELKLYGSCPYLYTWDGERFVFLTDLLWNAPLGLKFAENVIAPWREWEYLKIDGDKLRPKGGEYPLRVTAELWEIEYFDQIKLFAIDHPVGKQIFTNEKVGSPSMAEHTIHTVSAPRLPIAARDTFGRDVLDQIKERDNICTKTYDLKLAQGLTTDHFLELDLGDWELDANHNSASRPRVMLFLTGWMYPATTSLNVQFSQNPDSPKPRPPSLHAVDAEGNWREVRPFMGFPGGKTKTIALDISDVFPAGSTDHRLRIVTNMQFYWDAVFFTVDEKPTDFRQVELPMVRAQLQDRGGVSLRGWPTEGNGPEFFDYQKVVPGDMWAPISGAFTRFGDVLPLLGERDDMLVVMHPGDEIQLAFAVPQEPLPTGWVRDFVICNVGWDKDCDLNTVYGETVEPMPFREMSIYGEARPLDEQYKNYLKTYQTRFRPRGPYWDQLRRN